MKVGESIILTRYRTMLKKEPTLSWARTSTQTHLTQAKQVYLVNCIMQTVPQPRITNFKKPFEAQEKTIFFTTIWLKT